MDRDPKHSLRHQPPAEAGEVLGNELFAALDLGTNNCRLLVARPSFHHQQQHKTLRVVDSYSRIVRLGEGVSDTGLLSEAFSALGNALMRVARGERPQDVLASIADTIEKLKATNPASMSQAEANERIRQEAIRQFDNAIKKFDGSLEEAHAQGLISDEQYEKYQADKATLQAEIDKAVKRGDRELETQLRRDLAQLTQNANDTVQQNYQDRLANGTATTAQGNAAANVGSASVDVLKSGLVVDGVSSDDLSADEVRKDAPSLAENLTPPPSPNEQASQPSRHVMG